MTEPSEILSLQTAVVRDPGTATDADVNWAAKTARNSAHTSPLESTRLEERQRALRALLKHPMLCAGGSRADQFTLVYRHAEWLQQWLALNCGWRLQVDTELARLRKDTDDLTDGSRPARDPATNTNFSRRRYVLLCLAFAALERCDRQTTMKNLAEDIACFASEDLEIAAAGISLEMHKLDRRRDLVHVVRWLIEMRVLKLVDGNMQQCLNEQADALFIINRPALSSMLNVNRSPSMIGEQTIDERIAGLVESPATDGVDGPDHSLRPRLMCRLLEDPVLYYDDLDEFEVNYLNDQRDSLLCEIHEATGLIPEIRHEGIAMADDRGDLTDLAMPQEGTDGHLTLLLAEFLTEQARQQPDRSVSLTALHFHTSELIKQHRDQWRKNVLQPGAEVELVDQIIDRLEALRLVRRTFDGILPLPAIGRYSLSQPPAQTPARQTPDQIRLWQELER